MKQTLFSILASFTNVDCALLILSFLRKINFKKVMSEIEPEKIVAFNAAMEDIHRFKHRYFIRRLSNYYLHNPKEAGLVMADIENPRDCCDLKLIYCGDPYGPSNLYYVKKRTKILSKIVCNIKNLDIYPKRRSKIISKKVNLQFDRKEFSEYYERVKCPIQLIKQKIRKPIAKLPTYFRHFVPYVSLVFTEIIDCKKWWEIEIQGYLYRYRYDEILYQYGGWHIENNYGESDLHKAFGYEYFRDINRRYIPNEDYLRFELQKMCHTNKIFDFDTPLRYKGNVSIKKLFRLIMNNLN